MIKPEPKAPRAKFVPQPRPQKIPFYVGLGQPTLPRYVWLKKNTNKYNGDGTLKTK